jgi:C1A family cysteine protease
MVKNSIFCEKTHKHKTAILTILEKMIGAFFCFAAVFQVMTVVADFRPAFESWLQQYKVAIFSIEHREHVFGNWLNNHLFIEKSNSGNQSFTLGHNKFSGMNETEYVAWVRGGVPKPEMMSAFRIVDSVSDLAANIPAAIDWTAKGAVTPVKDQGQCGSCWSFSTTGALEGAYAIKKGTLASFSEQQLVDCDTLGNGGRDHGCNGGLMDNAFNWIAKNNGLCLETEYPYVSGTTMAAGTCKTSCKLVAGSDILKHVDVDSTDLGLMTALAQQPVSVAIEADEREFQLYKSGVLTAKCGTGLDHGVLVVGYGTEAGVDYYKIKNSWSTSWGENGYIRIGRGPQYNGGQGQCGVLLEASYPTV